MVNHPPPPNNTGHGNNGHNGHGKPTVSIQSDFATFIVVILILIYIKNKFLVKTPL